MYLLRTINMTSNFEFILSQNSMQQLIRILNFTCNRIQNSEISQQVQYMWAMDSKRTEAIRGNGSIFSRTHHRPKAKGL
jgi:hypothetical protein